ncbi:MAG TPA: PIN domain-containing protein [Thermoanaerobaculia bacterium]|nr:PIN domain-containing protein [Thermoanaerobaculia bacterium]
MAADRWFVDTNVLVYATNLESPWYQAATETLNRARQEGIELVISGQILREYLVVATRAASTPQQRDEVFQNLGTLQRELKVLDETSPVTGKLIELAVKHGVSGKQMHDANIVATMLVHGVGRLLTYNVDDFVRFRGEIDLVPMEENRA